MTSNKMGDQIREAKALNCPKAGDIWREFFSCYIYVCDIDDGIVRAMKVTGGGRTHLMFDTVGDFQDYIMYDTAPLHGATGWTWVNFAENDACHGDWIKDWVDEARGANNDS